MLILSKDSSRNSNIRAELYRHLNNSVNIPCFDHSGLEACTASKIRLDQDCPSTKPIVKFVNQRSCYQTQPYALTNGGSHTIMSFMCEW